MLLASLLLVFLIIQSARLFWTVASPVAPVGDWTAKYPQAIPAAARGQLFSAFDPFFPSASNNAADDLSGQVADVVTALPLTLFGIRSNQASGGGSAIVAGGDNIQLSVAVGEEIMAGVKLHAVAFDHIVISNNGKLEKLFLDQSVPAQDVTPAAAPAAAPAVAPTPEVSAPPPSGAQLNPQSLVSGVGLTPRTDGGKVTGLVVSAKDDGTMLRAAGLKPGDIILNVNGNPVRSPSDLASQFRPGARLSVDVERGAQKIPVAIILEKP
jgi:general secretion pathway protein C